MPSTILSDNGVTSGTAGIKTTGSNDGQLALQTTTAGGTATTALTIDTSQNVGIGNSSPGVRLDIKGSSSNSQIRFAGSGSTINRLYGDDDGIVILSADTGNTAAGSYMAFQVDNTERMRLNTNGAVILQGGSTSASGVGIAFPATQSASSDANTLDDYEEGTFTPTAFGVTSAGTTTYVSQDGFYTKIGRQVTLQIRVRYSAMTGTGALVIGGLPFSSSTTSNMESVGVLMAQSLNWSGGTYLSTYLSNNSSRIEIYGITDDGLLTQQSCVNESADLWITHTYMTA